MKKYYRFAGVDLEIDIPDENMYADERYMEPFLTEELEYPHRFRFELVEQLTPPVGICVTEEPDFLVYDNKGTQIRYIGSVQKSWEGAYARAAHNDREHLVQLKSAQYLNTVGVHTVLNCLAVEHLVAQEGGFIVHSSYINWQGSAILFTAPSQTGKSTQAALWESLRGAEVINGDRSVIRMTDDGVFACGIPFAGSSQICKNRTLPLQAIVYLKQAPHTTIRRLRGAESFRRIWEGCSVNTWDKEDVSKVSETVQRVLLSVPVYELACTPDESAIIALEGALKA